MKTLTLLIAFLLLSFIGSAQSKISSADLKNLRKGTFKEDDELYSSVIIKRTKRKQIEEDKAINVKMIFDIKWLNDSIYWLTFIKEINGIPHHLKKGDIIKATIISVKENSYTCKWELDSHNGTAAFTKIK